MSQEYTDDELTLIAANCEQAFLSLQRRLKIVMAIEGWDPEIRVTLVIDHKTSDDGLCVVGDIETDRLQRIISAAHLNSARLEQTTRNALKKFITPERKTP